jgi:hypothetical protein
MRPPTIMENIGITNFKLGLIFINGNTLVVDGYQERGNNVGFNSWNNTLNIIQTLFLIISNSPSWHYVSIFLWVTMIRIGWCQWTEEIQI